MNYKKFALIFFIGFALICFNSVYAENMMEHQVAETNNSISLSEKWVNTDRNVTDDMLMPFGLNDEEIKEIEIENGRNPVDDIFSDGLSYILEFDNVPHFATGKERTMVFQHHRVREVLY